jgi:hypothetical protein
VGFTTCWAIRKDGRNPLFSLLKPIKMSNTTEKQYTEEDLRKAFKAGARRGYSQRSIMAGADGTDAPDEDTWIQEYLKQQNGSNINK